jgi:hypothetical protein
LFPGQRLVHCRGQQGAQLNTSLLIHLGNSLGDIGRFNFVAPQSVFQMIAHLLVENDAGLSQAMNVESITRFQDLPQQETLSLLE